jgi:enoyl-CoA hydratase/carnithine racemase
MPKAQFNLEGEVGEIVIADPPLNLFGLELARDLASATDEARESAARAIFVRAEGDNFSAGANVEMFLGRDEAAARELIEEFMPVIRRFAEIPVPTVVAVQGFCLAAGLEVALCCDLIWAAEGAQLGLVEAVIGATPFGGGTQRLVARAGAGRAAEAVLTGRPYPA